MNMDERPDLFRHGPASSALALGPWDGPDALEHRGTKSNDDRSRLRKDPIMKNNIWHHIKRHSLKAELRDHDIYDSYLSITVGDIINRFEGTWLLMNIRSLFLMMDQLGIQRIWMSLR